MFWIAGYTFNSNGARMFATFYSYDNEKLAKAYMKLINRHKAAKDLNVRQRDEIASLGDFRDLRILSPAEHADRWSRVKENHRLAVRANEGFCPNCDKRSKDKGKARRCKKCGHVWIKAKKLVKPRKQDWRPAKFEAKILKSAA